MTTTARTATRHIATVTAALTASVLAALAEEFDNCQVCGEPAAYLYTRLDEDGDEIEVCETCVDTYRLAYAAD